MCTVSSPATAGGTLTAARGAWPVVLHQDVEHELGVLHVVQDELLEGVWLGKTSALAQVAAAGSEPVPGQTRYAAMAALSLQYVSDDPMRAGDDGLPLAWSCWEISMALTCRVRQAGFRARVVHAFGTEDGGSGEPHAVVLVYSTASGVSYVMDPYFSAGPLPLLEGVDADRHDAWSSSHVTEFDDGRRRVQLTVAHIAYPGAYTYDVHLGDEVTSNVLASKAPAWAAVRGTRIARASRGELTVRVTALADDSADRRGVPHGSVEVKVWVAADGVGARPRWSWFATDWVATVADAIGRLAAGVSGMPEACAA